MTKRYKVTNKKRFVGFLFVLCLLFSLCIGLLPHALADNPSRDVVVTVQSGDTLWDVCARNQPNGTDLRDYVEKVKYYNHKETSGVSVGETLRLPQ